MKNPVAPEENLRMCEAWTVYIRPTGHPIDRIIIAGLEALHESDDMLVETDYIETTDY